MFGVKNGCIMIDRKAGRIVIRIAERIARSIGCRTNPKQLLGSGDSCGGENKKREGAPKKQID